MSTTTTTYDRDAAVIVVTEYALAAVALLTDSGDIDDAQLIRQVGGLRSALVVGWRSLTDDEMRLLHKSLDWVAKSVEEPIDPDSTVAAAERRRFDEVRAAVATLTATMGGER